jgi:anthranilate synthase component 2
MKILVFDNYDSFTYNLVHLVEKITHKKVDVFFNDQIALENINKYNKIILSPGPGIPEEAGLLLPLIKMYAPMKSILGVCLGHQAIGQAFGATLTNLSTVYHGVASNIIVEKNQIEVDDSLFKGLPATFEVGRYHSWVVDTNNFPTDLEITATDENGYVMAMKHKIFDVQGVQFHPESILTPSGEMILSNWLKL